MAHLKKKLYLDRKKLSLKVWQVSFLDNKIFCDFLVL